MSSSALGGSAQSLHILLLKRASWFFVRRSHGLWTVLLGLAGAAGSVARRPVHSSLYQHFRRHFHVSDIWLTRHDSAL